MTLFIAFALCYHMSASWWWFVIALVIYATSAAREHLS